MIKLPNFSVDTQTQPRWLMILALILAVPLGAGVGYMPLPFAALGIMAVSLIFVWWMIRAPHITVTLFWIIFTLQASLFSFTIRGLYYPIYGLMLLNIFLLFGKRSNKTPSELLVIYGIFILTILQSLFTIETQLSFDVWQKIFIYGLGLLTLLQFTTERSLKFFPFAQIIATSIISIGVVSSAIQVGFTGRSGLDANANLVSMLVALGLIPMFTKLISAKSSLVMRLLMLGLLGLGMYASLLLASRGGVIAIAMAFAVILLRIVFKPKRYIYLAIGMVFTMIVLLSLPGSSAVFERFSGSDISSLNDRLPLWQAGFYTLSTSTPLELFFGNGFDSSRVVVSSIFGHLDSIHNAYLQFIIDYGILGLSFFLILHLYAIYQCWKHDDELSLHALGTIIALFFVDLTGTMPDDFSYWVALGFALAVASLRASQNHKERKPRYGYGYGYLSSPAE